jgi:hypothetical protein
MHADLSSERDSRIVNLNRVKLQAGMFTKRQQISENKIASGRDISDPHGFQGIFLSLTFWPFPMKTEFFNTHRRYRKCALLFA